MMGEYFFFFFFFFFLPQPRTHIIGASRPNESARGQRGGVVRPR
eukprot:NODE_9797_length_328_cov_55.175824.p4 GENE.NODE_9797_length_328_cov_55.175824~~NODE_9797_length_328_cov_55.175824.p4  ORF type:complete len:51 (+),score=50.76 NODE_9797_length_328_cov_55.175824:24-155(+)